MSKNCNFLQKIISNFKLYQVDLIFYSYISLGLYILMELMSFFHIKIISIFLLILWVILFIPIFIIKNIKDVEINNKRMDDKYQQFFEELKRRENYKNNKEDVNGK